MMDKPAQRLISSIEAAKLSEAADPAPGACVLCAEADLFSIRPPAVLALLILTEWNQVEHTSLGNAKYGQAASEAEIDQRVPVFYFESNFISHIIQQNAG